VVLDRDGPEILDQGGPSPNFLTPREREIAGLVARGHSNRRIAEELVIVGSTAERHVANILAKLNVRSRAEIAVWAVEHGLIRRPAGRQRDRSWSTPGSSPVLGQGRTNLPAELSSFVGRDRELRELSGLLSTTRLLTLTGAGGMGKTRLAFRIAANAAANYPHGVWLVRLDAVADGALVCAAIAEVLDVREQPGRSLLECVTQAIGSRHLLLVVDNCEHLIQACAELAEALLKACPQLQILATSRESLNVAGERAWSVPPLSLPEPHQVASANQLSLCEAVRLFIERALSTRPSFALTDKNAPAVALLCRRLDGIPLAIELAAARVKALSVEEIAHRLDDCLRLLTVGSRTALPRQQTLQAAFDWSYDLLSEPERVLFRRLGVFSGGLTLETAEQVCAREGIALEDVLDLLSSLVDKSLVTAEERDGAVRYRLLETMRQYALDRLERGGEAEALRRQHAQYFLALAEQAEPQLSGAGQLHWVERLEVEHDNLRAALRWCVHGRDAERGLRFGAALWRFWRIHGHLTEGRDRLTQVLGLSCDGMPSRPRAMVLNAASVLARYQCDFTVASLLLEESLAIFRELGDQRGIADVLNNQGVWARHQGNYTLASCLHEESLAIRREIGDQWGIASSLTTLGHLAFAQGDYAQGRTLYERSQVIFRELGDLWWLGMVLNAQGDLAQEQGDYMAAASLYEEGLAVARKVGGMQSIARCAEGLAQVAAAQGQAGRALRLAGAAARVRQTIGAPLFAADQERLLRRLRHAQQKLGEQGSSAAWAEGQTMSVERALAIDDVLAEEPNELVQPIYS